MKGYSIIFEGVDGSGKSTILNLVNDYLNKIGQEVVKTREPGGTPFAEKIRDIIINDDIDALTEAYLFATARGNHVKELIKPSLNSGKIVLCDRFVYSSISYQGAGRGLGANFIESINEPVLGGFLPDLVIYLDIPPSVSLDRIQSNNREQNRLDNESLEFYTRVRNSYLELAKNNSNFVTINANQTIEEVFEDVVEVINEKLNI